MCNARQPNARRGKARGRTPWPGWLLAGRVVLALALLPSVAGAISPERSLAQLHHTSWTVRDGAPENAYSIAQTSDGFLWFATSNGLFRFDGVRFERYQSRSGDGIQVGSARSLLALPDNGLLIGWLFGGATLLRDGHALQYSEKDGLPPGTVYGFQIDGAGTLWAATSNALARFDGKRWERVGAEWNFAGQRALALFVDRDGTLGVFTDSTLMTLPKGATAFRATGGKLTTRKPIVQSPDGTYFIADLRGIRPITSLNEYDRMNRAWNLEWKGQDNWGALLVDRDRGLWFSGAAGGVGRVARPEGRKIEVEYFARRDGLSHDSIASLFEDRDGSVWVSTVGGVDRFRSSRFIEQSASTPNRYPALMPEPDGAVRFAGFGQALYEVNSLGAVRRITRLWVSCAYRDSQGRAWYCSDAGQKRARLFRESAGKLQEVAIPDEVLAGYSIQGVVVDARQAPWISVVRQGIFRLTANGWDRPPELPDGSKRPALVMTTDARGGVWLGYVNNCVVRWQDGAVRTWTRGDGLAVGNVLSILATDQRVWVGGESGLAMWDGTTFRMMAVSNPDVLRGLTGIVETKEGNLWLHGAAGAVLIEARDVRKAVDQPGQVMAHRLFDHEDGLVGKPTELRPLPTLVAGADGRLWFGTAGGVFMVDPSQLAINRAPPTVVIDGALAGERLHRSPADLSLPALTTNLRVDYTATSLIAPRRVQFRYKLDGVDLDWKDAGTRRQAFYTNLGPGLYRFHVIAANEDGVWNQDGASFSFTIAPAWYQSRWFYTLCAVLLLAALALMYRVHIGRVRAQTHARLQARMLERERIARELHDTLIQGFQGLILSFDAAMRRIPSGQAPRQQMEEALSRADEVLAEGRDRVRGLRGSVVYQGELRAALTEFAEDLAVLYPTAFVVGVQGAERQLHPVALEEVYGIAREALANAFHHAGAQRVDVEVAFGNDSLRIRIGDNGKGIDADVLSKGGITGHWGLPGMRERAQKLGAKLRIRSASKAGTDVELEIPATIAYRDPHDDSWWRRLRRRLRKDANDAE
jgi:signal transduction histidine kinase/ligand-binding sensor domain-containing protein